MSEKLEREQFISLLESTGIETYFPDLINDDTKAYNVEHALKLILERQNALEARLTALEKVVLG